MIPHSHQDKHIEKREKKIRKNKDAYRKIVVELTATLIDYKGIPRSNYADPNPTLTIDTNFTLLEYFNETISNQSIEEVPTMILEMAAEVYCLEGLPKKLFKKLFYPTFLKATYDTLIIQADALQILAKYEPAYATAAQKAPEILKYLKKEINKLT